jgi:protein TonB
MAFADQQMSSKRIWSLILVGLFHVLLGYLFVSGLALKAVQVVTGPLETFEVEEEIAPPEEPPPPPPEMEEIPPYVPPPEVQVETLAPPPPAITTQTQVQAPAPVRVAPPAPVIAPPAPAPVARTPATPRGRGNTIGEEDYPSASRRAEEEGVTQVSFVVGANGRVQSCQVTRSSGHPRLDEATCSIIQRRFRFNPAKEGDTPVESTLTQSVRWELREG